MYCVVRFRMVAVIRPTLFIEMVLMVEGSRWAPFEDPLYYERSE
jgi:hypothetical protein